MNTAQTLLRELGLPVQVQPGNDPYPNPAYLAWRTACTRSLSLRIPQRGARIFARRMSRLDHRATQEVAAHQYQ